MWGHVRIEALLSARTVFGNPEDIVHLKQEGHQKLLQAKERYESIAEVVETIKCCTARVVTLEVSTCISASALLCMVYIHMVYIHTNHSPLP